MPFTDLLVDTIAIHRLTITAGDKQNYVFSHNLTCNMQASSKEQALLSAGQYGKAWNMYADQDADVLPTDKVIYDDGQEVFTLYVTEFRRLTIGNYPHIEAILNETLAP